VVRFAAEAILNQDVAAKLVARQYAQANERTRLAYVEAALQTRDAELRDARGEVAHAQAREAALDRRRVELEEALEREQRETQEVERREREKEAAQLAREDAQRERERVQRQREQAARQERRHEIARQRRAVQDEWHEVASTPFGAPELLAVTRAAAEGPSGATDAADAADTELCTGGGRSSSPSPPKHRVAQGHSRTGVRSPIGSPPRATSPQRPPSPKRAHRTPGLSATAAPDADGERARPARSRGTRGTATASSGGGRAHAQRQDMLLEQLVQIQRLGPAAAVNEARTQVAGSHH
jgi:hypothetical protein